jgi:hypothetical protein
MLRNFENEAVAVIVGFKRRKNGGPVAPATLILVWPAPALGAGALLAAFGAAALVAGAFAAAALGAAALGAAALGAAVFFGAVAICFFLALGCR